MTTTTDLNLQAAVERIKQACHPDRILLFGSRVRGDQRPDSDYDFLVVLPRIDDRWAETVALFQALGDLPISKDLVLVSREELEGGGRIGSVVRSALREAITVYERQ